MIFPRRAKALPHCHSTLSQKNEQHLVIQHLVLRHQLVESRERNKNWADVKSLTGTPWTNTKKRTEQKLGDTHAKDKVHGVQHCWPPRTILRVLLLKVWGGYTQSSPEPSHTCFPQFCPSPQLSKVTVTFTVLTF